MKAVGVSAAWWLLEHRAFDSPASTLSPLPHCRSVSALLPTSSASAAVELFLYRSGKGGAFHFMSKFCNLSKISAFIYQSERDCCSTAS